MDHNGVTTLWGKNKSNEVYYLSCPDTQLANLGSWSTPVPVLTGIERISAFLNKSDGGNTIFASGGGKLHRLIQSTDTAAKIWRAQEIRLPAPADTPSVRYKSYTTTIQVTDTSKSQPAAGAELTIATATRTPVFINGLYYLIGPSPVKVKADTMGTVTVIEATDDINSAQLNVSTSDGTSRLQISPMDKSFAKLAELNSESSLRSASFPSETKAGGTRGATSHTSLVSPSTAQGDVQAVASNVGKLGSIYSSVGQGSSLATADAASRRVVPKAFFAASPSSLGDDLAIAAGDLYRWLRSGADAVVDILKDEISDTWHIFATIAGKVYRAVLDTADAVVGAIEWVFNAVKTGIEDIIRYVEFLFDWDDISRSKDVMHNVAKLYLEDQAQGLQRAREAFDQQMQAFGKTVDEWTGVKDWSSLGDAATKPVVSGAANPGDGQTAGSQLLLGHFRDNVHNLKVTSDVPPVRVTQSLVDELLEALDAEGEVLGDAYEQLKKLATDFNSLSLEDILLRVAGILAHGVLGSVQVVVDALLNILSTLSSAAIGLLDTKIHIPVISDILNEIGVCDISILDLFTWIAAVGYTVSYKLAHHEAPFPDNSEVRAIISATGWASVATLFHGQQPSKGPSLRSLPPLSEATKKSTYTSCHAYAGAITVIGSIVSALEAASETGDNIFSLPSTVIGVTSSGLQGAANFLVPRDPVQNPVVSIVSDVILGAGLVSKLVFSGPAQKQFQAKGSKFPGLAVADGRATGAVVGAVLTLPALVVSGWHLYELSREPEGAVRASAIVGETTRLAGFSATCMYAGAVNDPDPLSKLAFLGGLLGSNVAVAGLQMAEALIY